MSVSSFLEHVVQHLSNTAIEPYGAYANVFAQFVAPGIGQVHPNVSMYFPAVLAAIVLFFGARIFPFVLTVALISLFSPALLTPLVKLLQLQVVDFAVLGLALSLAVLVAVRYPHSVSRLLVALSASVVVAVTFFSYHRVLLVELQTYLPGALSFWERRVSLLLPTELGDSALAALLANGHFPMVGGLFFVVGVSLLLLPIWLNYIVFMGLAFFSSPIWAQPQVAQHLDSLQLALRPFSTSFDVTFDEALSGLVGVLCFSVLRWVVSGSLFYPLLALSTSLKGAQLAEAFAQSQRWLCPHCWGTTVLSLGPYTVNATFFAAATLVGFVVQMLICPKKDVQPLKKGATTPQN